MQKIHTYTSAANLRLPFAIGTFPLSDINLINESEKILDGYALLHDRIDGVVGAVKVEFLGQKYRRVVKLKPNDI